MNITASGSVSSEYHCRICLPFIISTTNYLQHINYIPTTHYLLPTTYYLLPTTYCLLLPPATYYLLHTTFLRSTTYNFPPT